MSVTVSGRSFIMAYELEKRLVVGISSRALFDLTKENDIFEKEGLDAYCEYQIQHENEILKEGPGFNIVKALLNINKLKGQEGRVEIIIMSRNSADSSLRVFNSIAHYGLNISRAALASGGALAPYLGAFRTDLFLSAYEDDVKSAINSNVAAGIIYADGIHSYPNKEPGQIRIAFDGDAVLFSNGSEKIYQEQGLEAFEENERKNAKNELGAGPFAKFLKTISVLQNEFSDDEVPIRTALVTSRSAPAHERVIRTLRAWDVRIDEAFFLGGIKKRDILEAFGAHIFFDDQKAHTEPAAEVVPSARVPWKE